MNGKEIIWKSTYVWKDIKIIFYAQCTFSENVFEIIGQERRKAKPLGCGYVFYLGVVRLITSDLYI
jgi:hypothetical protein